MARRDNKAERQHYVPKVLLKNFAGGQSDGKVFVFDKHSAKALPKPTSILKICGERNFYVAEGRHGRISLESALSELETQIDPIAGKSLPNER